MTLLPRLWNRSVLTRCCVLLGRLVRWLLMLVWIVVFRPITTCMLFVRVDWWTMDV